MLQAHTMTQPIKLSQDLLHGQLNDDEVKALLSPARFADWRAAHRCLLRLADEVQTPQSLARLLPHLLTTLSGAANPDQVLVNLERFAHSATDKLATFDYLASNPRAVEILVALFAGSQFLTEILLCNPEYFERLMGLRGLAQHKSVEELYAETQVVRSEAAGQPALQLDALRRFQRWELLRIGACDLLNLFDLPAVMAQLSNLADSLTRACLEIASVQAQTPFDGFAVIAMGKLGGRELNYSSDIDLVFIAASDPGGYRRLGERLIEGLTRTTAEGFLYRVDMRLRPWGRVSPLVTSLDGYTAYLEEHARQWEKQALLKARPIAGDEAAGDEFMHRAGPLVFEVGDAEQARSSTHAMKQRTEAYLREQGRDWGEVKLGEGSIRDVEFVTQFLQLAHGAQRSEIRSRNTLDALDRLSMNGFLSADDYRTLADGYVFLRTIEHHLQMMHYRQTHALPDDEQALVHLAWRLGFGGDEAGEQLLTRYEQHRAAIHNVYLRYLGGKKMKTPVQQQPDPSTADVGYHVESLGQSYAEAFSQEEIERHAALIQQLDADNLVEVDAAPADEENWRVTIVAHDYPGELTLICGLLFAYGFSILDGNVFTYEPPPARGVKLPSPPRVRGGVGGGASIPRSSTRSPCDQCTARSRRRRGGATSKTWLTCCT
jgi:glutamate-ammonia-ligase adenylyltransferase